MIYFVSCVLINRSMCSIYMVSEPRQDNELRLWFRQGQLTIEFFDSDLDKVLVTYSQVESINSNFAHVDSNFMWILKPLYFIVIII